jgi:hypothetical protein
LLNFPDKVPFDRVEDVGVVVRTLAPNRGQVHIGMLYKIDAEAPLNLNLRDHLDLRNEPPSDSYGWMQVQLDEINRRLLSALCALIASKCLSIPYGFTYNGLYFTHSGDYVARDLGHGLTCATFVMAIFETYSIPILKTQEWTLADLEDQGWQTLRANQIRIQRGAIIADAIAQHVGQPRYRPEHVAAGAVNEKRPLGRSQAVRIGKRIMRELAQARK